MYAKLAALSLGAECEPLSDLHGCQQWWWLCMEVCHILWELYRKLQVPSSLSHLKKVCIIYSIVKFTTSSHAVCQHRWYSVVSRSLHLYILTEEDIATSILMFSTFVTNLKATKTHFLYDTHTVFILW